MATSLAISAAVQLRGLFSNPLDLTTPVDALNYFGQNDLTTGTGVNQANQLYHDQRSGTPNTLDLTTGLTNAFGTNIVFTKLRTIFVRNLTTTPGITVTLDGSFWDQPGLFTASMDVPAGGIFYLSNRVNGWIVDSTFRTITLSGAGATFDVILIGIV